MSLKLERVFKIRLPAIRLLPGILGLPRVSCYLSKSGILVSIIFKEPEMER